MLRNTILMEEVRVIPVSTRRLDIWSEDIFGSENQQVVIGIPVLWCKTNLFPHSVILKMVRITFEKYYVRIYIAERITDKIKINRYDCMYNLKTITFTKYSGFDPKLVLIPIELKWMELTVVCIHKLAHSIWC